MFIASSAEGHCLPILVERKVNMFSEHVHPLLLPSVDALGDLTQECRLPKKPQTPAEQEQIRARILQVAREVYDKDGYAAVTIRNIARQSGYSPAALYRYFSSHLELVRSVWQDAVDHMRDEGAAAFAGHDDPLERVIAVLRSYARFAATEPVAFRSTFLQSQVPGDAGELVRREGPLPNLDPREGTSYRILREAVSQAIASERMRPMDVDLAAQTLWATVHGVVALPFNFPKFPLVQESDRLEAAMQMITRWMDAGAPSTRPPRGQ
jgi:AcrR family transcriptional regulator